MCPAFVCGSHGPLALMPFARFRSLSNCTHFKVLGSFGLSCSGGFNRLVASVHSCPFQLW
jgi:hypothetical protein